MAINEAAVRHGVALDNQARRRNRKPFMLDCLGGTKNIPGHYLVALIVSATDYHWYRQDDTGFWSGKNGDDAPTNLVNGKLIMRPSDMNRDLFTAPRFYHVPKGGVCTAASGGKFLSKAREEICSEKKFRSPFSKAPRTAVQADLTVLKTLGQM